MKPFSESCEQNKLPILAVLNKEIGKATSVLEIGSGTGQHAVFFAEQFPQLNWHTSDVKHYHTSINAWINDVAVNNIVRPIELDVSTSDWPKRNFDAVFSANTTHIMSWPDVICMFHGIGEVLPTDGVFILYGPFNYGGQFTSESNARFDAYLKQRDAESGIRDVDDLTFLAQKNGLQLKQDYDMPANNRTLVWQKI